MIAATRFDTIVVGAGSAGAVIAARLSERAERSVLLLEAGPDHDAAGTPSAIAGSTFTDAHALPDRTWPLLRAVRSPGLPAQPYLRGRGIGGSSAINALVALPGEPGDYDEWAGAHGCSGWSWREVEPVFQRLPVPRRPAQSAEWGAVSRALASAEPAAESVPLTRTPDGRRASVNDVYLEPPRARPNLTVLGGAQVDVVLLDGGRVAGVRLLDGSEIEAGEVVVCAGAIHSPALLLRSRIDRPGIGRNLHDHPACAFAIVLDEAHTSPAGALPISVVARLSSSLAEHDLQVLAMDHVDRSMPQLGLLMVGLMRVHSRGALRLAGPDPALDPVVELGMLTDERDVQALREGITQAERILSDASFRAIGEVQPFDDSDEGIHAALGGYVHAAGSCSMGAPDDDRAVVDATCHVIGYDGLLVCDASVMPNVPRANTHLPTVMIAERVAGWMSAGS